MERSDSNTAQHSLLQNLRTMQVQCEPQSHVPIHEGEFIGLSDMIPILLNPSNASDLTHFRAFGCVEYWDKLPNSLTSVEIQGPLSDALVLCGPLPNLKSVIIRLVSSSQSLDFGLDAYCGYLSRHAPALEHLEVSLSPGTRTSLILDPPQFGLRCLSRLRSLFVDTYFISDGDWEKSMWRDPGLGPNALPLNIQTLRLVDSEPRQMFNTTIHWLQVITRTLLRPENLSKLKRVEFFHMPLLAGANDNAGSWNYSELANEVQQELALNGVQFHLCLVNDRGYYLKQEDIPA